jgi:hypothetical protein
MRSHFISHCEIRREFTDLVVPIVQVNLHLRCRRSGSQSRRSRLVALGDLNLEVDIVLPEGDMIALLAKSVVEWLAAIKAGQGKLR